MDDRWWSDGVDELLEVPDDVMVDIREVEPGDEDDGLESTRRGAEGRGWGRHCQGPKVTISVTGGVRYSVRREIAPIVKALCEETVRRGYQFRDRECWGYACRKIAGTSSWSNHSWGLAIDINSPANPMIYRRRWAELQREHPGGVPRSIWTDMPEWLPELWKRYGFRWGGEYRTVRDAMHFEFMLRPSDVPGLIEQLRSDGIDAPDALGPVPKGAEVDRVTHRVTATRLHLRSEPKQDGASLAKLTNGTAVERVDDELAEADGYRWIRVRAGVGPRIETGWMAIEYLAAEPGTAAPSPGTAATPGPDPSEPPAGEGPRLGRVTHHVTGTNLNVRADPGLGGAQVSSLPQGTPVEQLADAVRQADGYSWIKVNAVLDGALVEGWAASEFLGAADA
ncbi:MAG: M15 family metallopeptidase [Actinomycetota bacterium]